MKNLIDPKQFIRYKERPNLMLNRSEIANQLYAIGMLPPDDPSERRGFYLALQVVSMSLLGEIEVSDD